MILYDASAPGLDCCVLRVVVVSAGSRQVDRSGPGQIIGCYGGARRGASRATVITHLKCGLGRLRVSGHTPVTLIASH